MLGTTRNLCDDNDSGRLTILSLYLSLSLFMYELVFLPDSGRSLVRATFALSLSLTLATIYLYRRFLCPPQN